MEWIKIDRNEQGKISEKELNRIFSSFPVIIVEKYNDYGERFYNVVTELHWRDWRKEIKENKDYTHYLHLPQWT